MINTLRNEMRSLGIPFSKNCFLLLLSKWAGLHPYLQSPQAHEYWSRSEPETYDQSLQVSLREQAQHFNCSLFLTPSLFSGELCATSEFELIRRLDLAGLEPITIASLFEEYHSRASAKRNGVVYTPTRVVDFMLERIIGKSFPPSHFVFDPACGSGIFLLRLQSKLASEISPHCVGLRSSLESIHERLCGIDILPEAVQLSRLLLRANAANLLKSKLERVSDYSHCIVQGNSLFDPIDFSKSDAELRSKCQVLDLNKIFPHAFAQGGFDLVLGNPPYGLSRNEQLSPEENRILLEKYSNHRHGKINKYLAFMGRCHDLLKAKGKLALIVPNAWLGIKAGLPLRKAFLHSGAVLEISSFNKPVFKGTGVEAVCVFLEKSAGKGKFDLVVRDSENCRSLVSSTVSTEECLRNPDLSIPIQWSAESGALMARTREISRPLKEWSDFFQPKIALQAYALGKGCPPQTKEVVSAHTFHADKRQSANSWRYLEGKDIGRYSLAWSGSWLEYGPWLAEPQVPERFSGPRIILREILAQGSHKLKGTFVEEKYLYNKSVLHILPGIKSGREELLALIAILNSQIASAIIVAQGRKAQRSLFPKIVNDDLLFFPLPIRFLEMKAKLAKACEVRLSEKNITDSEDAIESLVAELYQVEGKTKHRENLMHQGL